MLPQCCDAQKQLEALLRWGYEKPNVIKLVATGWTNVQVSRPSFGIPLDVPSGFIAVLPGIEARSAPQAADRGHGMDTIIFPGGAVAWMPNAGTWSIWNSGNDTPQMAIYDASNGAAAMGMTCWDGAYVDVTAVAATPQSVLVTSTSVMPANPRAVYRMFQNDSANLIYLAFGGTAVASKGIRLNPLGGSYEMSKKAGNLYKGAVTAIAVGATSTLLIQEGGPPVPT